MIDRSGTGRHTYQDIAWSIRDRIVRGELQAGDTIPSLPAIQKQWEVSYKSAQAAVALLKNWGLVETRQSRGTFVLGSRPVLNVMTDMTMPGPDGSRRTWRQIVDEHGMTGTQRVIGAGKRTAPPDVADAYGYEADTLIAWRERLLLVDQQPVQISTSYYPHTVAEAIPAITSPEKLPANTMELMARTGHAIASGLDVAFARAATDEEAEKLEIEPGTPITEVFRVARNAADEVVAVERMVSYSARFRQGWRF